MNMFICKNLIYTLLQAVLIKTTIKDFIKQTQKFKATMASDLLILEAWNVVAKTQRIERKHATDSLSRYNSSFDTRQRN